MFNLHSQLENLPSKHICGEFSDKRSIKIVSTPQASMKKYINRKLTSMNTKIMCKLIHRNNLHNWKCIKYFSEKHFEKIQHIYLQNSNGASLICSDSKDEEDSNQVYSLRGLLIWSNVSKRRNSIYSSHLFVNVDSYNDWLEETLKNWILKNWFKQIQINSIRCYSPGHNSKNLFQR